MRADKSDETSAFRVDSTVPLGDMSLLGYLSRDLRPGPFQSPLVQPGGFRIGLSVLRMGVANRAQVATRVGSILWRGRELWGLRAAACLSTTHLPHSLEQEQEGRGHCTLS